MFPYLHIGFLQVPTYGLMLSIGAAVGAILFDRAFRRAGIATESAWIVAIALLASIVGSKLWYVFIDAPAQFGLIGWKDLWNRAGFSWYGALIFGIAALAFQGWQVRAGGLLILDLAAPAAAIGQCLGRIGCFLSGDGCYGIPIKLVHLGMFSFRPWGISFPNGLQPVFVPVYPTPLYESTVDLAIGWWLWSRLSRPHAISVIAGQYLVLTGASRFAVEFIRRDPKVLWGLSVAQLTSTGVIVVGGALVWWALVRRIAPVERPALSPGGPNAS